MRRDDLTEECREAIERALANGTFEDLIARTLTKGLAHGVMSARRAVYIRAVIDGRRDVAA